MSPMTMHLDQMSLLNILHVTFFVFEVLSFSLIEAQNNGVYYGSGTKNTRMSSSHTTVVPQPIHSWIRCAAKCSTDESCDAFAFNECEKLCHKYRITYCLPGTLVTANGWTYYRKESPRHLNLTYAMLMNETVSKNEETKQNAKCRDILGFKKGQVLSQRGSTQGTFGRDQLSKTGAFYSMDGYDNARTLNLYPSEADFTNNQNVKSYSLPTGCDGAQAQMIGGKLFCAQTNASLVLVYDLANLSKPYKLIKLSNFGTNVAFRNKCSYQWHGFSDIDIEFDETGVYIVWANVDQNCNFVLGRVDPLTFAVDKTWQIPITKTSKGNAFMVCGKLYMTDSYRYESSSISHVFDICDNNIVTNPGISYSNEYGYAAHAHYDPMDKVLYVWDRGHQLRVEIMWK